MSNNRPIPDNLPPDADARQRATDPAVSFIVQAPAGSGKTELLSQRLLRLLATVDRPEEILAITFTRKAAEEMKGRVLAALHAAVATTDRAGLPPHTSLTLQLAEEVLKHDSRQGWNLLENPSRLRLQTIDSFCAYLVRRMPWVSRFGGQMQISEQPENLYRLAAERLLSRTEEQGDVGDAVVHLLDHLDNRLWQVRNLLVTMMARRDQWAPYVLAARHRNVRAALQENLERCCGFLLTRLEASLSDHMEDLFAAGAYAAANLAEEGRSELGEALAVLRSESDLENRARAWDQLLGLLCTAQGQLRKTVNRNQGFPAGSDGRQMKERMTALLGELSENGEFLEALAAWRRHPNIFYEESEWRTLQALLQLLPAAIIELKKVFVERGEVDYVEVAGAALQALGDEDAPEELLLQLDAGLKHILVDEFQDTSILQFRLLERLTTGWQPGDGRTLFLVGDPMQSIYRFRQAEVSLFLLAAHRGLGSVKLEPLRLCANFRSQGGVVSWVNRVFSHSFPDRDDALFGAVTFSSAVACHPEQTPAVNIDIRVGSEDQSEGEAEAIVDLVEQLGSEHPDWTIAVLARARNHLQPLIRQLRRRGLPFQGQDLDTLLERQVIVDLHSLTRALLHPADRISWLAVLRAPWCGMTLADLDNLIQGDRNRSIYELLEQNWDQGELFDRLSEDGRARWQRIRGAVEQALARRGRVPLRRLVESTWLALGGPACVSPDDLRDVERFFQLLEAVGHAGDLDDFSLLEDRLQRLFAEPGSAAGSRLQLMTIHKAKGLEFDVVILPGLHRRVPAADRPLLNWLDHPEFGLMLASLRRADSDASDATYEAIQAIQNERDRQETTRLMYVAATRAKHRLYLFGQVRPDGEDIKPPPQESLLGRIWEAVRPQINLIRGSETEQSEPPPSGLLLRLPSDWRLPDLASPVATRLPASTSPSSLREETMDLPKLKISLRSGEGRLIGTLVHSLLEKLGPVPPDRGALEAAVPVWKDWLVMNGVPRHRCAEVAEKVLLAMKRVCEGEHYNRLFGPARDVRVEWGLNGLVEGRLQHAVIDRSFIDEHDIRWIIDFKTTAPGPGQNLADFLKMERSRYLSQLELYASLVRLYDSSRNVETALYYPMIDCLDVL